MGADEWLYKVRANRHMWPLQMTSHPAADQLPTELFMRRERRRLQARHIWMEIKPKWHKIKERIWTKHFVAHAVRARGSDGHQNVCGRSTILKL